MYRNFKNLVLEILYAHLEQQRERASQTGREGRPTLCTGNWTEGHPSCHTHPEMGMSIKSGTRERGMSTHWPAGQNKPSPAKSQPRTQTHSPSPPDPYAIIFLYHLVLLCTFILSNNQLITCSLNWKLPQKQDHEVNSGYCKGNLFESSNFKNFCCIYFYLGWCFIFNNV